MTRIPFDRRLVLAFLAPPLLVGAILRLALVLANPAHRQDPIAILATLPLGLLWDLAVWPWLALLPFLWTWRRSPGIWLRSGIFAVWIGFVVIQAAVEWNFWDEFSSRFNHVAIDYLLYPREVASNIWESFNVPLTMTLVAVVAAALGWLTARWVGGREDSAPARGTLVGVGAALALATVLAFILPTRPTEDRELNEISGNGTAALVRAVRSSVIDYPLMYATLPAERMHGILDREVGSGGAGFPAQARPAVVTRAKPYDVLVVLEESLGAEFSKGWNGHHDLTPELDRWQAKGTAFMDCVPTGNRTVRGLEGVLTGLLPVPPDSVVKRSDMASLASLARVFNTAGLRSEFFYGGAAAFDNLGPFATAAGFTAMHDDPPLGRGAFPADAFRTAWGVADEHLFAAVLARQKEARARQEPLFITALTVSNHRPFLVPGDIGKPHSTSTGKQIRVAVVLTVCALLIVLLIVLRRRIGWTMVVSGSLLLAAVGGGYATWKIGATDTRYVGVRYADRAVGQYLDQAAKAGILDHTVVLVVGDHGARVYGSAEMPLPSYRVVALAIHPEAAWQGRRIEGLCSQIDLPPTICSLAGLSATAPFPGVDLARLGRGPGRAFVQHNRNIGLLTDTHLAVLGLKRERTLFERSGSDGTHLLRIAAATVAADPALTALLDRATAWFQATEQVIRNRTYRLP